jgi:biopolymer transport protein ExbD
MKLLKKRMLRKSDAEELDITSLLDILVILLVFLLQNYSASELKVEPVKDLTLSNSLSRDMGKILPTIQLDKHNNIWYKNQKIVEYPWNDDKISYLKSELQNEMNEKKSDVKGVNLFIDEEIKYENVQKVMELTTSIGFNEMRLIVKVEE